jgi:hypothetical protein
VTGGLLSPCSPTTASGGLPRHPVRRHPRASLSPQEAADRLAIRELIDAYAHCVDRRDAKGQMALFTEDTRFLVYMDATDQAPTQRLEGRESLNPVFDNLNTYAATTHFNGQSTVSPDGDRSTGESYCLCPRAALLYSRRGGLTSLADPGSEGAPDDHRHGRKSAISRCVSVRWGRRRSIPPVTMVPRPSSRTRSRMGRSLTERPIRRPAP